MVVVGVCMVGGGYAWWGGMHDRQSMHGRGACMVEGVSGRGYAWWGAYVAGGMHGAEVCMSGETATEAGSICPTGMHSCSKF